MASINSAAEDLNFEGCSLSLANVEKIAEDLGKRCQSHRIVAQFGEIEWACFDALARSCWHGSATLVMHAKTGGADQLAGVPAGMEISAVTEATLSPAKCTDAMNPSFEWLAGAPCWSYTFKRVCDLPQGLVPSLLEACDTSAESLGMENLEHSLGLQMFDSLKKVDFTGSKHLGPDEWGNILASLSTTIQDISVKNCGLNAPKASRIAQEMPQFSTIKKVDFQGNKNLGARALLLVGP